MPFPTSLHFFLRPIVPAYQLSFWAKQCKVDLVCLQQKGWISKRNTMYPWVLPATHCLPVVLAQLARHFYPVHHPWQQTYSPLPVPTNQPCVSRSRVYMCVCVLQSDAGKAWYVTRSCRPTSVYTSTEAATVRSQWNQNRGLTQASHRSKTGHKKETRTY